jgi:hypothetical protein
MRITLVHRIARWVTARSGKVALSETERLDTLNPAQMKRLLMRLHDLEWQVRGLTEQCSALKETISVHDWSLEALWEQVQEARTPAAPVGATDPAAPKKKTLN